MARRDLAARPANEQGRARLELEFEQPYLLGPLFGDYDRHLITIEQRLGVHIAARGNRVQIEGEADSAARARDVLIGLYNRLDQRPRRRLPKRSRRCSAWPLSRTSTGSSTTRSRRRHG